MIYWQTAPKRRELEAGKHKIEDAGAYFERPATSNNLQLRTTRATLRVDSFWTEREHRYRRTMKSGVILAKVADDSTTSEELKFHRFLRH